MLRGIVGLTGATGVINPAQATSNDGLEEFKISGTKQVRINYYEDIIEVNIRKRSKDLATKLNYSPPVLTEEKILDRKEEPNDENIPTNGSDKYEIPWNAYIGSESKWRKYFEKKNDGIGTLDAHAPEDDQYPNFAVWTFEEVEPGDFQRRAPINVWVGEPLWKVGDVIEQYHSDWSSDIAEGERFVWEAWDGEFKSQNVGGASWADANNHYWSRRYHIRAWETGADNIYTSIQAHEDNSYIRRWNNEETIYSYFRGETQVLDAFDAHYQDWHVDSLYEDINNRHCGEIDCNSEWVTGIWL